MLQVLSPPTHHFTHMMPSSSPPTSRPSSRPSSRSSRPSLSLDLSDLPPLSQPAQPSNTLLITNLQNPQIFTAATLDQIRRLLEEHAPTHALNSFSPLKSLRRLIVSLPDVDSAVAIRAAIDGMNLFGDRVRVYFGEPTPLQGADPKSHHLAAPRAAKQFFISPPPSPPAGWTMRDEDPPNKNVHPDDLASALAQLGHASASKYATEFDESYPSPMSASASASGTEEHRASLSAAAGRQRSGSTTIVFKPEEHGRSPDLPAIAVEDTTETLADLTPIEVEAEEQLEGGATKKILAHTARPPVELMNLS